MLNFSHRDRPAVAKDTGKAQLKPALYDPPGSLAKSASGATPRPASSPYATPTRDTTHPPVRDDAATPMPPSDTTGQAAVPAAVPAVAGAAPAAAPGSKLFVGVNIKLKGVEISDCDVLVIEGHVEATVHSKTMQIAKPGTLVGTALIDVAEVHGEFSGELTARTRLVVHGTGRVSGTIRYGKLVVAEGGEINGDVKRLEASNAQARTPTPPPVDARRTAEPVHGASWGTSSGPEP